MHNKIKEYVHELMKGYKVFDKQLEIEIVSACCDEYDMQIENGIESENAYSAAIADVANIIREKSVPKNKFIFSFIICCCALIVSVAEMIVPMLSPQPLEIYGFEMPLFILALCGLLVFIIVKRREFHWFDYIILALFLLSWISALIQIGIYAYHATMPDRYWDAEYGFPCIIKILTYTTETFPNVNYELASIKNTYSFNFIISIISLIIISALIIKERHTSKRENQ